MEKNYVFGSFHDIFISKAFHSQYIAHLQPYLKYTTLALAFIHLSACPDLKGNWFPLHDILKQLMLITILGHIIAF